jgi:hypothetical protein
MSDFSKYSRQQLIDLCRTNKVKGFSHKSIEELIGLLLNAGIKPADTPEVSTEAPSTTNTTNTTNNPNEKPHQYIFHTSWEQVLPYIEEHYAKLVLVDLPSVQQNTQWIAESLRILETGGTLLIRGLSDLPEIQHSLHASWISVGSEKVLILRKEAYTGAPKTLQALYDSLIHDTPVDSTILMPFASASDDVCKLLRNRSFITMDCDEARVSKLYAMVH